MSRKLSAIIFMVLAVASSNARTRAGEDIRLLSEKNGELVVQVAFDSVTFEANNVRRPFLYSPGLPELHYVRFFVAVPGTSGFEAGVYEGKYDDRSDHLPKIVEKGPGIEKGRAMLASGGFFPRSPVEVSGPYYYRNVPVIAVSCFARQVDYNSGVQRIWSTYKVKITFPAIPGKWNRYHPDPFVSKLVINKKHVPPPALTKRAAAIKGSVPDAHFDLSQNWVKIEVAERGMYVVTGQDLFNMGFSVDGIESSGIRLFTGGGENQSRSFADTNGTWRPGKWMKECAIAVFDGGDGEFNPQDSLVFYGLGSKDWKDYYNSEEPDTEYYDNLYAKTNCYFLTWDGAFGGQPRRMSSIDAQPEGAPYDSTFMERMYFEKNIAKKFNFGGDGWLWLDIARKDIVNEQLLLPVFQVRDAVLSSPQIFRTIAIAPYCGRACSGGSGYNANANHHALYKINGTLAAEAIWDVRYYPGRYEDGQPVRGSGFFLQDGSNRLALVVPRDLNPHDFMYFDWYSIFYERYLRAVDNELGFSFGDTTGRVNFEVRNFSGTRRIYVFDVTNQLEPAMLTGFDIIEDQGARKVRFSSSFSGAKKHFWVCSQETFKRPFAMYKRIPKDLRNVTTAPNMLIVYNNLFRSAAEDLRTFRTNHLPYYSNPVVSAVDIDDVFDNFSGGLPDPMAIRNYCKFLYDNFTDGSGSPLLGYLLLFGDANSDYKNFASSQPDYVITDLILDPTQGVQAAYATDSRLVYMDPEDEIYGNAVPDIAVGRFPVASTSEARHLVNKTIAYEAGNEFGTWRNRIILVADDEVSSDTDTDSAFTLQSEDLANFHVPSYIDVFKLYLTEFPFVGGIKPSSRKVMLEEWNKGALLINFIGHGSSLQMTDELVFLDSDVGALDNGTRLPLLFALSCTIGDFDNGNARSLSEKLLLRENGGTIGVYAASQVSYVPPNFILDYHLFDAIFPPEPGFAEPLGSALILAKQFSLPVPSQFIVENDEKFNLIGDPAVRLLIPRKEIKFDPEDVNRIIAGTKEEIHGSVMAGTRVDSTFTGSVRLVVRESDDTTGYYRERDGFSIPYNYPGGIIYEGDADVSEGRFAFSFHIPRYPNVGSHSHVVAYAQNGRQDASATRRDVILAFPSSEDSLVLEPLDGPPRVEMGFKGGVNKVKPGAVLRAEVHDKDGINILNTTNEGRQVLIFDDINLPLDVTDFFDFNYGGSDTSGVLLYPLKEETPTGDHRAIYKVADSFGQICLDTLYFSVIDPMANYAEVVFNYPNPFSSSTYFLFHLSGRAEIKLDIYTTSGKHIRSLSATRDGGEAWIYWDGRDYVMDPIANGTYLFVAKVRFIGSNEPAKILRGKLMKIE